MEENKQGGNQPLDLAELSGFQFGPAWARKGAESDAKSEFSFTRDPRPERRRGSRPDAERGPRRDRRERAPRNGAAGRQERERRPRREQVQPAEGFRVELRPVNAILEVFSSEIRKKKRAHSLLDFARIVMANKERYDLVFMKQENGSAIIHSVKGDGACWLTEAEAVAYLWNAPWFSELYTKEEVEVEVPKGTFTAVAVAKGGEIIGPVNWHGYQGALMALYREKYAALPLSAFKNEITLDKSEETIAAWLQQVQRKTVWKPTREGATDTVLEDARSVEEDFRANGYASVYEVTDKVFISGATPRRVLSPGLAAHLHVLAEKTRNSPQMLIPNLCHGLARHHMPIYKWQGKHFTGPSRVRVIPEGTVLADRMVAIVDWTKAHSGKKVEEMFSELSGVPAGTDEESRAVAAEAYAPYAADMIWLMEQGFVVVTADNSIWYPKGEAAPASSLVPPPNARRGKGRRRSGKPAAKAQPTPAAGE